MDSQLSCTRAFKYLLWFLESSREHVPLGQCVIFIPGEPAFYVHERLEPYVDTVLFLYDYLMVVRDHALRTRKFDVKVF